MSETLIVGGVVPPPTQAVDAAVVQPLREGVPTTAGTTYSLNALGRSRVNVTITDPVGGRFGYVVAGMAGISDLEDGTGATVDLFELGSVSVVVDPTTDPADFYGEPPPGRFAEPPTDYLAWIAERPGVTAGPIRETVFAGLPSREMRYEVGEVAGAEPCTPDPRGCLLHVTNLAAGYTYLDLEQMAVVLHEVKLAGLTFIVAVAEEPGAAELASTLTFTEP